MSQENVDIAERAYDAFRRRDLDALRAVVHPDIIIHLRREVPEGPTTFHGLDGARALWDGLDAVFDEYRGEPGNITTAGDCVVADIRQSGRFAGGGSRVEGAVFHALWFRDSKLIAMRHYTTRAEALDAVELSE